MKLSPSQSAAVDLARVPGESLAVCSVAGSGKTTVLVEIAKVVPATGISTTFSKDAARELKKRMPRTFPARTCHGMGKDDLVAAWGSLSLDTTNEKVYKLVRQKVDDSGESPHLIAPIMSLVDKAQSSGIAPLHSRFLLEDTHENWESLADHYDLPFSPFTYTAARRTLIESNDLALNAHKVNFNDLIYIPTFWPIRPKVHKVILADEIQDLTPLQLAFLRKHLRPNGWIIGAGDPHQAIYAFRGAMANSFDVFVSEFSARVHRLNESYRCPRAITREAQAYVPEMCSTPEAPEGEVIHHSNLDLDSLPRVVVCPTNAPIARLAMKLLVRGHTVEVAGKDIGGRLKSIIKRVASGRRADYMKSEAFMERIQRWGEREKARRPKCAARTQDKLDTFAALAAAHPTLGKIKAHIESLYSKEKNRLREADYHLTTIHRAKGREWPNVLFLNPESLPAKWSEQPWEIAQDNNLSYVGITRSQSTLHYTSAEAIRDV